MGGGGFGVDVREQFDDGVTVPGVSLKARRI
jgi:hypothetical protein